MWFATKMLKLIAVSLSLLLKILNFMYVTLFRFMVSEVPSSDHVLAGLCVEFFLDLFRV